MRRVWLLDSARDDIAAIAEYIARASGSNRIARRFARELTDKCRHIGSLPGLLGRARPELYPDIRSFPFKNYMIFFRYVGDDVEIVNVIERHRNIDDVFGNKKP